MEDISSPVQPFEMINMTLVRILLEVINNFGLLVQLSDVHHSLAKLSPPSVNHLVPHHHLSSGVNGLLFSYSNETT